MSGHSKWATIKHKKALTDAKRGKVFSKLSKIITIAAKEKGGDPQMNPRLRTAVDQAKAANMPSDNIDKAIKKGSGELEGVTYSEVTYEAYGPEGIAIIIEGITDNKNRTVAELKHMLGQHGGNMATSGSVLWMFKKLGKILIHNPKNTDDIEMIAIEAGADDIQKEDEDIAVYTSPDDLYSVKKNLEDNINDNGEIESAELVWQEDNSVSIKDEKKQQVAENLFEALDEHEDVQAVYSNLET